MPTWQERQAAIVGRVLKREQDQHADAEKMQQALVACWEFPPFQLLVKLLDLRFDPEINLLLDEPRRQLAAEYWQLRRKMEQDYAKARERAQHAQ